MDLDGQLYDAAVAGEALRSDQQLSRDGMGGFLADRLGKSEILPGGVYMALSLAFLDAEMGESDFVGSDKSVPRSIAGYPAMLYVLARMQAEAVIKRALGDHFATAYERFAEDVRSGMENLMRQEV